MKQQSLLMQGSPKKKYTLLTTQSRKISGERRLQNSTFRSREHTSGTSTLKPQEAKLVDQMIVGEASQNKNLVELAGSTKWSSIKKQNQPTQKIVSRIRQNIKLIAYKMEELFGEEIEDEFLASLIQEQSETDETASKLKKARSLEEKGSLSNQKNKKGWKQYYNGRS